MIIGLDGYVKVLNLEALTELFSITTEYGVTNLMTYCYKPKVESIPVYDINGNLVPEDPYTKYHKQASYCIMFAMTEGTVEIWKITAYCDFFGLSNSTVERFSGFSSIHEGKLLEHVSTYAHGNHLSNNYSTLNH